MIRRFFSFLFILFVSAHVMALAVGDPQVMTDDEWYPGELSCSTFARLFARQAAVYTSKTSRSCTSDEDKAIASWYWRQYHYYHFSTPEEYQFSDSTTEAVREYWNGLWSYGFALCGTTHAQYTAEMEYLLGHARGRVVGVGEHNSHEAFITGGSYGSGDWVLLDQDEGGIVFHNQVTPDYLIGINDIVYSTWNSDPGSRVARSNAERENILDNDGAPAVNRGWYISNTYFHSGSNSDATDSDLYNTLTTINQTEPLSGYASVPPIVSLRRNESFRRYLVPGLGGSTAAFWAQNNTAAGSWGPDGGRTWCNQPNGFYQTSSDSGWHPAQAEYGNGVYTYAPNFGDGSYVDGVVDESGTHVTFYFYSPYVIAATPPNSNVWGVKDAGCTNGLKLSATSAGVGVQLSTNNGTSWSSEQTLNSDLDLTDLVKGHHSYHLRFNAGAATLDGKDITITTVTQCNDRLMPHLKSNGSQVTYQAGGKAVFAAGPNSDQAETFLVSGTYGSNNFTLEVPAPNGAKILEIYAAAWANSSCPPTPGVNYNIDYSTNDGASWNSIVSNWQIDLLGYQSDDWWSQTLCYGSIDISAASASTVQVRFSNDGGKTYRRAEVMLVYETNESNGVDVTFNWTDGSGTHTDTHSYPAGQSSPDSSWTVATGANTVTNWVEFTCGTPVDPEKPTANFTFSPTSPTLADTVTFTDTSTTPVGTITNWSWDFGGDGTSTAQSPTHMFSTTGTFAVTLIVTNSVGKTDSIVKNVTVTSGVSTTDTFQQGTSGYSGCDDTYLREEHYSVPYGASDEIRIYGDNAGDWSARIAIRFDLSSIPAGSTVTDVELQLYGWNIYEAGTTNMYETTADWDEAVAAWRDRTAAADWAADGGDFSATLLSSLTTAGNEDNSWLVWGSTANFVSVVQGWIDSPSTNHGVMLVSGATAVENRFRSSEWATVTERPKLIVTYDGGAGPDSQPPAVNVTAAALEGTVDDDSTVPTEVILNGSVSIPVTAGDWQSGNVALSAGTNNLTLEASDASSNTRQVNLDIVVP